MNLLLKTYSLCKCVTLLIFLYDALQLQALKLRIGTNYGYVNALMFIGRLCKFNQSLLILNIILIEIEVHECTRFGRGFNLLLLFFVFRL